MTPQTLENFWNTLTDDALVLTPNKRLAAYLQQQHIEYQRQRNISAWESLPILPIDTWLKNCFQNLQIQGLGKPYLLLNSIQTHALWTQIISKTTDATFTKTAVQAWTLLQQHRISRDNPELYATADSEHLAIWAQEFEQHCAQHHFICHAQLASYFAEQFKQHTPTLHSQIYLLGFLDIPPDIKHLLDILEHASVHHHNHSLLSRSELATESKTTAEMPQHPCRTTCSNEESEIQHMAHWAKNIFTNHPDAYVGCIVPQLHQNRTSIQRIFSKVFSELPDAYNISAGTILHTIPIIYTALMLLKLNAEITLYELGHILRTPFLGDAQDEQGARALLFNAICERGHQTFTMPDLVQITETTPLLQQRCLAWKNIHAQKKQKASAWMDTFRQQLEVLGWPQHPAVFHAWQETLDNVASLDHVMPDLTFKQALYYLEHATKQKLFQTRTEHHPRIQILGTLEAAGICFSHCWIMGMDQDRWPTPIRPNPLLPITLQRQHDMPHASAEREFRFCQAITEQLCHSSGHIIFSYAQQQNGNTTSASPLITDFPEISLDAPPPPPSPTTQLEHFTDDRAPTITPHESIRGGTSILKYQAACPFQAFAKIRLHAAQAEIPSISFTAKERGTLLHLTMEYLWKDIQTHQQLCRYDDDALHQCIQTHITHALPHIKRPIPAVFQALEKERLDQLIFRWLSLEKERIPFAVTVTEQRQQIQIGPLPIHTQVDRIDQTADGKNILIDYKTGEASIKKWLDARPDEPQLPIYAITAKKPVDSIAFAQIRSKNMQFHALSKTPDTLPNDTAIETETQANWETQLKQWTDILESLAQDFHQGKATVDPKKPSATCKYCDLHSFCRIYECNS